ncbi:hypothetical protein DERP_006584 [Dermatophagoides pteronyssinus]|uniref:Uncharacterized protein n=1 Tax=Dermatophagoides pteronyssinus TaxID=6956 RepID=A0ABQ8IQM9_DERPT|nr:hypothetical protein DERP_006584 [Dermatophagoides pteronyssinus]
MPKISCYFRNNCNIVYERVAHSSEQRGLYTSINSKLYQKISKDFEYLFPNLTLCNSSQKNVLVNIGMVMVVKHLVSDETNWCYRASNQPDP